MPLTITTIPCLSDNYAYLLTTGTGAAAVVDVPDAAPINAALQEAGVVLTDVLLTHHHWDHVQGLDNLTRGPDLTLTGNAADADRLPPLDQPVRSGESFELLESPVQVIDVPGHTIGHVAFYLPKEGALFSADSLMTMGCGRLFEGSPAQMWDSLQRLRALPEETRVYTGHEYTQTNMDFALSLTPDDPALQARAARVAEARAKGQPTTGATLAEERATNPFLRADDPAMAAALGMEHADPTAIFAEIRARRDKW